MPDNENNTALQDGENQGSTTVRSELNRVSSELSGLAGGLNRVSEDLTAIRERLYQIVPIVSLALAKQYLRVDSADEDAVIGSLLNAAAGMCRDVARLSDTQWKEINSGRSSSGSYSKTEMTSVRETLRVAILYTLGYLFEHREDADHHKLADRKSVV